MVSSTLRVPDEVHRRLRAKAQAEGRSINDVIVEILDRETRRWQGLQALRDADRIREDLRCRYGDFPDSTAIVRELREDRSSRG